MQRKSTRCFSRGLAPLTGARCVDRIAPSNDRPRRQLLQDFIYIAEVLIGTWIGYRGIPPHIVAIENIDAAFLPNTDELSARGKKQDSS